MITRLTILLVFVSTIAVGQIQDDWEIQTENFVHRIKNIEFFMERFNSRESTDTLRRNYQLLSVFDLTRLRAQSVDDKETVADFIRSVNRRDHQVLLDFYDPGWFAELSITTKSSGVLTCLLRVTPQPNSSHGWSVVAMTPDGKNTEHFADSDIVFPPNANGTDFMSVVIAFREGKVAALNEKNIRAEMIQHIRYHFLQIDGWIFTVDYVDRNAKNSGWLVSELVRATAEEKINYRRNLHLD